MSDRVKVIGECMAFGKREVYTRVGKKVSPGRITRLWYLIMLTQVMPVIHMIVGWYWSVSITVTPWWARWRLKSPAFRLFAQQFIQAQIKEDIKALRHWPLWGESTGDRWIPLKKR